MTSFVVQGNGLEDYRWKNRLVLVFESADDKKEYITQLNELNKSREGINERDMLVFLVRPNAVTDLEDQSISPLSSVDLKKRFGIGEDEMATLLIGKDGGVKLRSKKAVSSQELFALIDGMPMRRSEIRRKNGN